jgi:hypothetical protein
MKTEQESVLTDDVRVFQDAEGKTWHAIGLEAPVAHGKRGAVLAFRPEDAPDEVPLRTPITFNSDQAAKFALRTMGVMELRRRLSLALRAEAGL